MTKKPTYEDLEQRIRTLEKGHDVSEGIGSTPKNPEAVYRLMLESISDTVIVTNDQGKMTYVCPNTTKIFGLSQDEVLSLNNIQKLMDGSICDISDLKEQGEFQNLEWTIKDANTQTRFLLINVKSVNINGGTVLYVIRDITDRKQDEEDLKRYRNIVSSTSDGISLLDKNYRYVIVNDAYEKFSGVDRENFIGLTVSEYLGKEIFEKYIQPNFDKCLQGETVNYQGCFEYPTIGKRFVDITYYPYRDSGNLITGVVANTRDITLQRLAEEALHKSREKYQELAESISDVFFAMDKNLRYTFWNKASEILTGIPAEKAVGKTLVEVFPDNEAREQAKKMYLRVIETKKPEQLIVQYPGNEQIVYEISAYPSIEGVTAFVKDITERKRMEEVLRGSEEKFRNLIETLPIGVALSVPEGTITEMNSALVKIFGYDSKEELQKVPGSARYVNPKDRERYVELLGKGLVRDFEGRYRRKDGTVFWGRSTSVKRSTATGETQFINVFEDITERKKAEKALRESEQKYRNLVDNATVGVFKTNFSGDIAYVNDTLIKMLEFESPEEFMAAGVWVRYKDPKDREIFLENLKKKGKIDNFETELLTTTGRSRNVLLSGALEGDFISGMIVDITERKQMEDALIDSERKWRNVLINTPQIGISLNPDAKIIFANAHFQKITGWKKEEIIGQDWFDMFIPENVREEIRGVFKRVMSDMDTSGFSSYENNIVTKNGELRHIAWSNVLTKDAHGQVSNITCLGVDLTERKQAEDAIKKSEARLRNVFEALPLGIVLVQDRRIMWHNETTSRMLGYSGEELHEKNTRMLYISDEDFKRVGEAIKTLGPGKRAIETEIRWVRKDGSVLDCHIRHALMGPESEDRVVLAMVEDITERKKAEEEKSKLEAQFNQAQKMEAVGTLAGGIAHDFNNILTVIIGNTDLALMDLGRNTNLYDRIDEIQKAGHQAAALTRQLLAFSRKELIRPEVLDLNGVTMNLEKMLRRLIREDVDLVTDYAPDPWQVEADPGQMAQVIMNLAVNARDAMPKGGKLTIETVNVELDEGCFRDHGVESKAGPYVMLAVTDTGAGMDRETQARIFEPFFTTKGLGRGTGLGLSTVYGIVKQNKGYIWVYSEEGRGTTLKVYLPRADVKTEGFRKEQPPVHSLRGSETILVVEDDEMLRKMAERVLKGYGYRVLTAENGREAIKIASSHDGPIHLMLTDVVMPGMTGPELSDQLKSTVPEIKVLYMSGYTSDAIAHHGVLEKDVDFIQKPFSREGLGGKVREVLDKKQD